MKTLFTPAAVLLLALTSTLSGAAEPSERELDRRFADSVQPLLKKYCFECHGNDEPEAELDLRAYATSADVAKAYRTWEAVLKRLESKEMPPEDAKRQPTADERAAIAAWIGALRKHAAAIPGGAGSMLARRLSNAEYDYTVRDLTGVDIRPTREFPIDPANEAGFDNSAESLSMSPTLVEKYLQAARHVSEFLVLKPDGFTFAPHPAVTDTDRDKYSVNRIVQFYRRQPTDLADYFLAAWRYENRAALGKNDVNLAQIAAETNVSAKYLAKVWSALAEKQEEVGPLAKLQRMWRELPRPEDRKEPDSLRVRCEEMRDWVVQIRAKIQPNFKNLVLKGVGAGSQPFVLWKDRQYATHRLTYDAATLQIEGDPNLAPAGSTSNDETSQQDDDEERPRRARIKKVVADPDLTAPADAKERAPYAEAFARFAATFPDAFYIAERGRIFLDRPQSKEGIGRLLSAGFHSMMGYFRDDIPLCELILDENSKRELDELWKELDFITLAPIRQHTGYIWYERAESGTLRRWGSEFDVFRSEDKDITSEARLKQFAELYLARARESYQENGGDAVALEVLDEFFKTVNTNVRALEKARLDAEPSHLASLLNLAERAYRRPMSQHERDELLAFYRSLRAADGMSHEDAIRDTLVSVLMSPHFCFRIDLAASAEDRPHAYHYALASRLSYFLWSSMPDAELLAHAEAGDLHEPAVLVAQARRMLQDDRAGGMALEFGGNWLDFRRFEEHNAVDRERFPTFTSELRQAMFEEPFRFLLNMIREDRSVLDFVYGDYTFVNPVLARHYGMPATHADPDQWLKIDDADKYGRGGLLPMAVFMTKNSPGLRTSPVKRGYWVVRRLLGEVIPPPPNDVPELPEDEAKLDLPLPQMLAQHRENKSCSVCHERFDSMGLVFENFGPVGERRSKDLAGRAVHATVTFPKGGEGSGVEGLRRYIREQRQDDFLDNLCRKLLSYGLGRSLVLVDEGTVRDMRVKLDANDYRFTSLVESIVTSPQFLAKSGGNQEPSKK